MTASASGGIGIKQDVLILDLGQAEPGKIPRPVTPGICSNQILCLCDDVATEWVTPCQSPQLGEHLVAGDIVIPRRCHGGLEGASIFLCRAGGSNTFDPTELCESVDAVRLERLDELADRLL